MPTQTESLRYGNKKKFWKIIERRDYINQTNSLQATIKDLLIIKTAKRLGYEIKDFLVRVWREAIYGKND